jgi:hypothetical protein
MRWRRNVAVSALLLCSCEALAQASSSGERVLQSFGQCRGIADRDARLDCFDKAATALETAVKAKDVTIVDRQEVRRARRSLFGFTVPKLALFGGGDREDRDDKSRGEEEEFTELNTTVVSARPAANGRVEFRVAEGDALWVTTDPMNFPPKAGVKVRIRKGALGNYFISFAGERSVRGMRLR